MKAKSCILVSALFLCLTAVASAEVRFDVTFKNGHDGHSSAWRPYRAAYYHPHPYYRNVRPVYYYEPVVVQPAPVYVSIPVVSNPAVTSPELSGNYGQDLANLREKMKRLRNVLQHQTQTGQVTPEENQRFSSLLDGIEHDEHARAYDKGGNLTAEDFTHLHHRLDQVSNDIQIALAT